MRSEGVRILDENRLMAIATIRPDGWPQNTIVGYANAGFTVYFLIFRASQKFANIQHEPRVAIAVGKEPPSLREAHAVYAGAEAAEVTHPAERQEAWRLLVERHSGLAGADLDKMPEAALMRAECTHLSIVDYSQGLGHTDALHLAAHGESPT
jgi:nitroimidazol reductase NimA-like FMN-containing flavoprotein (pyridoxamine 5'-phosphate oxidase superfamily)